MPKLNIKIIKYKKLKEDLRALMSWNSEFEKDFGELKNELNLTKIN